jgi:hypothetical protein
MLQQMPQPVKLTLADERPDAEAVAATLLAQLHQLEAAGMIRCRWRALHRVAEQADPELRRALFLAVGMELAEGGV